MRACAPTLRSRRPTAIASKECTRGCNRGSGRANELAGQLDNQKSLTSRAMAQVELLNQQIAALRRQLAALESALEASEAKDKDSQAQIADLGQRLNLALAQRVQELVALPLGVLRSPARRFSAIVRTSAWSATASSSSRRCCFDPGLAVLQARRPRRARQARGGAARARPADSDRHRLGAARRRPHRRAPDRKLALPSNWELSSARAISVVQYPDRQGHLAAASRRRRLRRVPAARSGNERRRLSAATAASS